MKLELHVWGPALEVPSIDPECLAALSYMAYAVPRADWNLIASNDTAISPDHTLPALHHNGTWTSGYLNIVSYLAGPETGHYSIDDELTQVQRADTLAYASYLTSRGAALLAFSLYVSPSAWAGVTRPAYSNILPFPLTWTIPPSLRATAIAKTEHLGLDRLAADVDPENGLSESKVMAPVTSTGFLRLPTRPSVSTTMQPEQAAAIRLQNLTDDFFSVLGELRANKKYFLSSEKPSSLDFLAYSFLRLMQVKTPHPFFANCMKRSEAGRRLLQFVGAMNEGPIRWQKGNLDKNLPWEISAGLGVVGTTGRFADGVLQSVPGVGEAWTKWWKGGMQGDEDVRDSSQVLLAIGSAVAGVAALVAATLFQSLSPFGASVHHFDAPRETKGLHQFGDIGAMFDRLPGFEPPTSSTRNIVSG